MNLGTIKTLIRNAVGTSSDDPQYTDAVLEPIVQAAYDALIADIQLQNRGYLSTTAILTAGSATSHSYAFSAQTPAITLFAYWMEVRWNDEEGALLAEARLEDLRDAGEGYFAVTGPDATPVLVTSPDSPAGETLFIRYGYWPLEITEDADIPTGVPTRFHDVIVLESLFGGFGIGGEQRMPKEYYDRWIDRRAQLMSRLGRRGVQVSRSRIVNPE